MPERPLLLRRLTFGVVGLLSVTSLSGCLSATGGVRTFEIRTETIEPVYDAPARVFQIEDRAPSPLEISYARSTARVVFKNRDVERTRTFVSADPEDGYALCLRAGKAFALLVFQRRVFEPGISQVDDDAAILRRDADTAVCRGRTDWTAA